MKIQTFQEAFLQMMHKRIDYGGCALAIQDPKHKELNDKSLELMQKIILTLGDEHSGLLYELEEIMAETERITLEYVYKQGFQDGIQLNHELNNISSVDVVNHHAYTC